ncbi:MAG: bifunctional folylpolyglutamate synthase/dihydrofolate synthase [Clostridiales bacterium]|nr:bifunctional folylpolyglutamate synthase/dihydrofolate synthase [Clostridiales bacterium]
MNYRQAIEYLDAFPAFTGKQTDNEDLLRLLSALGNPQKGIKCIHVAGTNGKGSVCAYLSTALAGSGYRTGLFTSPYLLRINERIRINSEEISDDDFARVFTVVKNEYERSDYCISCFAVITAAMFVYFREQRVDIAVIEVGLGGRIDPTNVCEPIVSVITSIAMDHAERLGGTLQSIALEKAGIVRKGIPVVIAPNPDEVKRLVKAVCIEKGAPFREVSQDRETIRISIEETAFAYKNVVYKTKLLGKHQIANACTALETIQLLRLNGFEVKRARQHIAETVWPARMQLLCREPLILLDGAHNPQGAKMLADFAHCVGKRFALVVSVSADKDLYGICSALAEAAGSVYVCAFRGARAATPQAVAETFEKVGIRANVFSSFSEALEGAIKSGEPIMICGSLYLAGEALAMFGRG